LRQPAAAHALYSIVLQANSLISPDGQNERQGDYTREHLCKMNDRFAAAMELAFEGGGESREAGTRR